MDFNSNSEFIYIYIYLILSRKEFLQLGENKRLNISSRPDYPFLKSCIHFFSSFFFLSGQKVSTSPISTTLLEPFVVRLASSLSLSSWPAPLPLPPPPCYTSFQLAGMSRPPFSIFSPRVSSTTPATPATPANYFPGAAVAGPIIKIESSGRGLDFVAKINWRALIATSRFNFIPFHFSFPFLFFFVPFSKLYKLGEGGRRRGWKFARWSGEASTLKSLKIL